MNEEHPESDRESPDPNAGERDRLRDGTAELVAFLDGELDAEAAEAVEARISLDPRARAEADALKRTWDLLDFLPRAEPSPDFTERTLSQADPSGQRASKKPARSSSSPTMAKNGPRSTAAKLPVPEMIPPNHPKLGRRIVLALCWLIAVGGAGVAGYFGRSLYVAHVQQDKKSPIDGDRHLLKNLPRYRYVESKENLHSLDDPELFGEEP